MMPARAAWKASQQRAERLATMFAKIIHGEKYFVITQFLGYFFS